MRAVFDLKPPPSPEWTEEWETLMRDSWLQRKTDRNRRLAEHLAYADKFLPELKSSAPGVVIDLGPGCGELLEIARQYGHQAIGVDAVDGAGGMGDPYLRACRLMHQRQGLYVEYMDALGWLARNRPEGVVAVNLRGSVEQIFAKYMDGVPHSVHQNCKSLSWRFDNALYAAMRAFFKTISGMLRPGGVLMIHANGARNSDDYNREVQQVAGEFLALIHHEPPTIHKWRRECPASS